MKKTYIVPATICVEMEDDLMDVFAVSHQVKGIDKLQDPQLTETVENLNTEYTSFYTPSYQGWGDATDLE